MDALEARGDAKFDRGPKRIRPYFQRSGIYMFLISFACLYYLSNASLLLGHYDLGWHLAAGDIIRDRGNIPFQDPWSFTLGDKQWYNLSWLWDVFASVLFQYTKFSGLIFVAVACGANHSRISCVRLLKQRSLSNCRFVFPSCPLVCFTPPLRRLPISTSPLRQTLQLCCFASFSTENV
jgi:hypothetical protein